MPLAVSMVVARINGMRELHLQNDYWEFRSTNARAMNKRKRKYAEMEMELSMKAGEIEVKSRKKNERFLGMLYCWHNVQSRKMIIAEMIMGKNTKLL